MFKKIKRWFSRPSDPSGYVYYARLKTPQGIFYKLGYTKKPSLRARLSYAGLGDEKLIDQEFLFAYHPDAWDVEQTLLEHFSKERAFGMFSKKTSQPLAGRGQSELFAHDVLGLDLDLYRLSEEEKAALASEIAQANEGCLLVLFGLILVMFTFGLALFFIAGGLSGVLNSTTSRRRTPAPPKHPPIIRELVESLVRVGDVSRVSQVQRRS